MELPADTHMAADTLGDLRVDVQGVLFSRQWLLIYQLTH